MSGDTSRKGEEPVRTKLQQAADAVKLAAHLLQAGYYALRAWTIWPL
ncbi:hypothetical protein LXH09_33055 [Streptomyces sp. CS7]|nr:MULTISPECIES: hypothetical protein [unclassified Streptomyces]MCT6781473.1 hypothetical protein [Streptomyces sp. CS-7]